MRELNKDDLSTLPKKKKGLRYNYNWELIRKLKPSIRFIYNDIAGEVKVIDYMKKGQIVTIEYNNAQLNIRTNEFLKCAIGSLLNEYNRTLIEGTNDIHSQEQWMVKYFVNPEEAKLYTKGMHGKIKVKCPICGTVKDSKVNIFNLYRYKSIGCLKCGDGISYPNKFCFNLLKQLNIEFEAEYSPEWLNNRMRYDFFIPSLNLIIEMDGDFHNSHEVIKESDKYKNIKAKENNVELIRIDCSKSNLEYIKNNILNSNLSKIFNFSNIDWLMIEEFCLSSRVKEVCDIWENGIQNVKDIMPITGLSKSTICKYLNQGTNLGWCNYNGENEKIKNWSTAGIKTGKRLSKKVEIFKDGISLGIFDSISSLEKESQKLFGVKLNNRHISKVCLGQRKSHKGFTFKHV